RSSRRTEKERPRGSLRFRRTRHRARAEEARAAPRRNATRWSNLASNGRGRLLFGGNARDDCGVAPREIREPAPLEGRKAVTSTRRFPIRSRNGRLDDLIVTGGRRPD